MTELAEVLLVNRAIIEKDGRVLVVRRTSEDARNAGLWEFPGGKTDHGETIETALAREVLEETGLRVELTPNIVHFSSEIIKTGKYAGKLYLALFHAAELLGGEVELSHEHEAAHWVEIDGNGIDPDLTDETATALAALRQQLHV